MTAINDVITALGELVAKKMLTVEQVAQYLRVDRDTAADVVYSRFIPSAELTAELEALGQTLREDPSGEFARKLIAQPREHLKRHEPRVLRFPEKPGP